MTEDIFLRLVEENTANVFNLGSLSTYRLGVEYVPRVADLDEEESGRAGRHGGEIESVTYRNVIENVRLKLKGIADGMLFTADALESMFHTAKERQRRKQGNRVFVEYRPAGMDSAADKVRSEILWGKVEFLDEPLSGPLQGLMWEALIVWKRRYYWETLSEVPLPLTNTGDTDVTDGVEVTNSYETNLPTSDNYVYINVGKTDIGRLPAPAKISMTMNTAGSPPRIGAIYISNNIYSSPATNESNSHQHILQAEAASKGADADSMTIADSDNASGNLREIDYNSGSTEFTVGETITGVASGATGEVTHYTLASGSWAGGDAAGMLWMQNPSGTFQSGENLNGSSGGSNMATTASGPTSTGGYATFSWTGTGEAEIAQWTLDSDYLDKANGNWFKILGAFFTDPAGAGDYQVKWEIKFGVTTVFETLWLLLDNDQELQEMHAEPMKIPPQDIPNDQRELTLVLTAKHSAAGSHSLVLDFIQVSPLDGWRLLTSPAEHLAQGETLVDDGIEGRIYTMNTAGGNYRNFVGLGDPIMVDVSRGQILYFLARNSTGAYQIDHLLDIEVSIRPRSLVPYIYDPLNAP